MAEDLTRDMEDKELEGRQKMEKIEQETRDMERRYQEEINRRISCFDQSCSNWR